MSLCCSMQQVYISLRAASNYCPFRSTNRLPRVVPTGNLHRNHLPSSHHQRSSHLSRSRSSKKPRKPPVTAAIKMPEPSKSSDEHTSGGRRNDEPMTKLENIGKDYKTPSTSGESKSPANDEQNHGNNESRDESDEQMKAKNKTFRKYCTL